jgi:hypothetical protein
MLEHQLSMDVSQYEGLYEDMVLKYHLLRSINS